MSAQTFQPIDPRPAPVKTEGEDGEEHTTVTAQQVDKVKAEYDRWAPILTELGLAKSL